MASSYDAIDTAWSWNGDFLLGSSADLADTSSDTLQSLVDQISVLCSSAVGDWFVYPTKGASLDDFIGEPNTQATADALHDRIRITLTSAGVVLEEDLYIRVVPVSLHQVMIVIVIDAIAGPTNRLGQEGPLRVVLVYDTQQQNLFFVEASTNNG